MPAAQQQYLPRTIASNRGRPGVKERGDPLPKQCGPQTRVSVVQCCKRAIQRSRTWPAAAQRLRSKSIAKSENALRTTILRGLDRVSQSFPREDWDRAGLSPAGLRL